MPAVAVLSVGLAALACGEGDRFLPLDRLCAALAEDRCEARRGCCGAEDRATCIADAQASCSAERALYERETGLTYDAARAASRRDELRAVLEACTAEGTLARFFAGGRAIGTACERDPQCETGRCDPAARTCASEPSRPLCATP